MSAPALIRYWRRRADHTFIDITRASLSKQQWQHLHKKASGMGGIVKGEQLACSASSAQRQIRI